MKKITCVTSYGRENVKICGYDMIASFIKHWPESVELLVYLDDLADQKNLPVSNRVQYKLLNDHRLMAFKARNSGDAQKHGLDSFDHKQDSLKYTKPKEGKWNFLKDAIRFSHKVFAVAMALEKENDILIWLDGDTKTFADVPLTAIDSWLPIGKFAGFLDRPKTYTETGFHIFDTRHKTSAPFFKAWFKYYVDDSVFALTDWTDCHTYDAARMQFDQNDWYDLSPNTSNSKVYNGHVFINGPLGQYMDHMKGKRKLAGKSNQADLFVNRTEEYWKKK